MPAPAPFTHPLATPSCPLAWRPEYALRPTWVWRPLSQCCDHDTVLMLLAAAELPCAELLHMGAPPALFAPLPPLSPWLGLEVVRPLLGRIAWDARFGEAGEVWRDTRDDQREAMRLGKAVVDAWFTP